MSAIASAEPLLKYYKVESDPAVALAMFEALGEACFFAFSPGAKVKVSLETRDQTLEIAGKYVVRDDPETALKGAEVVRKLLEVNNLEAKTADLYLTMLLERYQKAVADAGDDKLKIGLLGIMGRLCSQGSYKAAASEKYKYTFVQTLDSNNSGGVRQAGARGLYFIDKTYAYKLFKTRNLLQDEDLGVRLTVIEAAGFAGGVEDLDWLAGQVNANGHAEQAWKGIDGILSRASAQEVFDWAEKAENDSALMINRSKVVSFYEQVAEKAKAEENADLLIKATIKIVDIYKSGNDFDKIALQIGKIKGEKGGFSRIVEQKGEELFAGFVQNGKYKEAVDIIGAVLAVSDLNGESGYVKTLKRFVGDTQIPEKNKDSFLTLLNKAISGLERPQFISILNEVASRPEQPTDKPAEG